MPEDQAVLDYYRQAAPVTLGEVPQIDPALLQAAMAAQQAAPQQAPQTQVFSSQGQPPVPVVQQPAPQLAQQQAGYGMQIQPQSDEVLFPEIAWTSKKEKLDKQRLENEVRYNQQLAKDATVLPEAAIKSRRAYYESLNKQRVPEMPDFEKANPNVELLKKEIAPLVQKRNQYISALASFSSQADEGNMLPGESEREWAARISPQLLAQLKLYNTALVGSSDALSSQEVSRIVGGQLVENFFTPSNLLKVGVSATSGNIKAFKQKIDALHDILLNQANDGFNILAAQSSPKYATQALGYAPSEFRDQSPAVRKSARMDETATKDVILGKKSMAQAFFEKQEALIQEETNLAKQFISQGKSKEAVKAQFKKNTGRDLKLTD